MKGELQPGPQPGRRAPPWSQGRWCGQGSQQRIVVLTGDSVSVPVGGPGLRDLLDASNHSHQGHHVLGTWYMSAMRPDM